MSKNEAINISDIITERKQLEARINALHKLETDHLINDNYPSFKSYEGRYFKTRNNFSLPKSKKDYWFVYTKVLKVEKEYLYTSGENVLCHFDGFSFQECSNGDIIITNEKYNYIHSLMDEISEKEFNEAFDKIKFKLSKIR